MIIVKIIGGLGNQMFQYAYAKALQHKGYEVKIDISAFDTYKLHGGYQLDKYNIDLPIASKKEVEIFYKKSILQKILDKLQIKSSSIIKETSLVFSNKLLYPNDNSYIQGYFQSEKYFKDIKSSIISDFTMKNKLSNYTTEVKNIIFAQDINSCSIHVRRGDYVNNLKTNKIHGSCSLEYYQKAIELLNDKYTNMKYFVFSDDINWVKKNLKIDNVIYIDSEEKRIPHEDIYLMSLCRHSVISNSSFSWWGAWLNGNDDQIIIAPKRWFADEKMFKQSYDIVPTNWQRI